MSGKKPTGKKHKVLFLYDKRELTNGKCEYKLRWEGFGPTYDSWVPQDEITPDLVASYETQQAAARAARGAPGNNSNDNNSSDNNNLNDNTNNNDNNAGDDDADDDDEGDREEDDDDEGKHSTKRRKPVPKRVYSPPPSKGKARAGSGQQPAPKKKKRDEDDDHADDNHNNFNNNNFNNFNNDDNNSSLREMKATIQQLSAAVLALSRRVHMTDAGLGAVSAAAPVGSSANNNNNNNGNNNSNIHAANVQLATGNGNNISHMMLPPGQTAARKWLIAVDGALMPLAKRDLVLEKYKNGEAGIYNGVRGRPNRKVVKPLVAVENVPALEAMIIDLYNASVGPSKSLHEVSKLTADNIIAIRRAIGAWFLERRKGWYGVGKEVSAQGRYWGWKEVTEIGVPWRLDSEAAVNNNNNNLENNNNGNNANGGEGNE